MRLNASSVRAICAAALIAWLAGPAFAEQPLTFDWTSEVALRGDFMDFGAGPVLSMTDAVGAGFELRHGLWGGAMSYGISGGFSYSPQKLAAGDPLITAFLAYPGKTAMAWETLEGRLYDPWFRAALGRQDAEEPTGLLFRNADAVTPFQLMDGLSAQLRYQWFFVEAQAGFIGLLDKRINRILLTPQDAVEQADMVTYAAPPRGLAILRLEARELLAGQSFGLFGVWQKDFRAAPPLLDSWYIGAAAQGRIVEKLRQESGAIVAITVPTPGEVGAGLLMAAEISYDLDIGPLRETWLSGRWGSGAGGGLEAFPALAGPPASTLLAVQLMDIVRIELGVEAELPVAPQGGTLNPGLAARLLLTPGGSTVHGFAPAGAYLGTELELAVSYVPLMGLRADARTGVLLTAASALPFLILEAGFEL